MHVATVRALPRLRVRVHVVQLSYVSSAPPTEPFSPWRDRRVAAVCGSTAALMLGRDEW